MNPNIVKGEEQEDATQPKETPSIVWPDGITPESREKIEAASLPTLKSWYARKSLEVKGSAAWDPAWTREEAINAYIKISGKKAAT